MVDALPPRAESGPDLRSLRAVGTWAAVLAVVLLGLSMRLVFGSASALLPEIRDAYTLGSGSAALLTTGPVVCLGLFGSLAARAISRWTVPVVLTGCLILVAAGTALRATPLWPVLLLGTLLAGIGIAVANVLGPVLVRLLFPHRVGVMTGLLTALVSASAGIASGATASLDTVVFHSWRLTLLAWAAPAVLAVLALGVVALRHQRFHRSGPASSHSAPTWQPSVLRSPVTWAITGFMGLQSLLAYAMIGWLPTIYRDRGLTAEHAGLVLTALSVASILTALAVPMIATRIGRQSVLAVAVVCLSVIGLLGVIVGGTGGAVVWAVLLGLGQGGQLSLALTLVNLRAASASVATSLSTVAQSVGYLIAAVGPVATGILHGASGSWTVPLVVLILLLPLAVCGWVAGRPKSGCSVSYGSQRPGGGWRSCGVAGGVWPPWSALPPGSTRRNPDGRQDECAVDRLRMLRVEGVEYELGGGRVGVDGQVVGVVLRAQVLDDVVGGAGFVDDPGGVGNHDVVVAGDDLGVVDAGNRDPALGQLASELGGGEELECGGPVRGSGVDTGRGEFAAAEAVHGRRESDHSRHLGCPAAELEVPVRHGCALGMSDERDLGCPGGLPYPVDERVEGGRAVLHRRQTADEVVGVVEQ